MQCFALIRTDIAMDPPAASDKTTTPPTVCIGEYCAYSPLDIQSAYALPIARAKGAVVATVDAYAYPTAASDLARYRSRFKLPPCTVASGCLRIVNQNGASSPLPGPAPSDTDWPSEQALDIDMISAACPECRIVLVETNDDFPGNLAAGVNAAVSGSIDAAVVSNSYGSNETSGSSGNYNHPGHVIVASAGDNGGGSPGVYDGAGPQQPCSYSTVVCVGGTSLRHAANKRGWNENVWNDWAVQCSGGIRCGATGSGCSALVAKPTWQHDTACPKRAESDISAVAAVTTPVWVYTTAYQGFTTFGGTSASAPLIAGMFALTGNARTAPQPQSLWSHGGNATLFNDVLKGQNISLSITGPCDSPIISVCVATGGYDGPTGWGTPHGIGGL
jgi:subtilase family serine protease